MRSSHRFCCRKAIPFSLLYTPVYVLGTKQEKGRQVPPKYCTTQYLLATADNVSSSLDYPGGLCPPIIASIPGSWFSWSHSSVTKTDLAMIHVNDRYTRLESISQDKCDGSLSRLRDQFLILSSYNTSPGDVPRWSPLRSKPISD